MRKSGQARLTAITLISTSAEGSKEEEGTEKRVGGDEEGTKSMANIGHHYGTNKWPKYVINVNSVGHFHRMLDSLFCPLPLSANLFGLNG